MLLIVVSDVLLARPNDITFDLVAGSLKVRVPFLKLRNEIINLVLISYVATVCRLHVKQFVLLVHLTSKKFLSNALYNHRLKQGRISDLVLLHEVIIVQSGFLANDFTLL